MTAPLGEWCLHGRGAERLHEELIPLAARWIDPSRGNEPLAAYAAEAEAKTLQLLDQALSRPHPHAPSREIEHRLLESAAADVEQLLPLLERRAEEAAALAKDKLQERGQREAKELRETLVQQHKRVVEKLDAQSGQLSLEFMEDERRQLELDIRAWKHRLEVHKSSSTTATSS